MGQENIIPYPGVPPYPACHPYWAQVQAGPNWGGTARGWGELRLHPGSSLGYPARRTALPPPFPYLVPSTLVFPPPRKAPGLAKCTQCRGNLLVPIFVTAKPMQLPVSALCQYCWQRHACALWHMPKGGGVGLPYKVLQNGKGCIKVKEYIPRTHIPLAVSQFKIGRHNLSLLKYYRSVSMPPLKKRVM